MGLNFNTNIPQSLRVKVSKICQHLAILEKMPSIEVRPTASLHYHVHIYALDIELRPWISIPGELWSWLIHTHTLSQNSMSRGQSVQKIEWKQTDRQTDRQDRLHYLSPLTRSVFISKSSFIGIFLTRTAQWPFLRHSVRYRVFVKSWYRPPTINLLTLVPCCRLVRSL